jgi:hypothetical protein
LRVQKYEFENITAVAGNYRIVGSYSTFGLGSSL